jgi:hypothetical protein
MVTFIMLIVIMVCFIKLNDIIMSVCLTNANMPKAIVVGIIVINSIMLNVVVPIN